MTDDDDDVLRFSWVESWITNKKNHGNKSNVRLKDGINVLKKLQCYSKTFFLWNRVSDNA